MTLYKVGIMGEVSNYFISAIHYVSQGWYHGGLAVISLMYDTIQGWYHGGG